MEMNIFFVIIGCFHLWERSVWAVECLTALYTGPLWVTDSWAGSLLTGWLHTVSLYPLTGRFRYPCESGAINHSEHVMNPLTGQPVDSWYGPGESYDSKFTTISKFIYVLSPWATPFLIWLQFLPWCGCSSGFGFNFGFRYKLRVPV